MNLKPYTPSRIDGCEMSLTARQKLAHVRKALDMAADAKRYWPNAKWQPLLADLERQEAALSAEIARVDNAIYGKSYLRPEFVNTSNDLTAKLIVWHPNDKVDMPFIPETSWTSMKRLLNSADGNDIEVNADYEVYVCRGAYPIHIIPRYE